MSSNLGARPGHKGRVILVPIVNWGLILFDYAIFLIVNSFSMSVLSHRLNRLSVPIRYAKILS